ncbi:electron transport complex subunit E [bacterium]|nr:electron transport complex subunit E [bacterium]
MKIQEVLTRGLWTENPVFRLMLGLCPVLATSTSVQNAVGMGIAVIFVLTCSNLLISLIRSVVPDKIRIPIFISIIATFVTLVDLIMAAYFPDLHKSLGLFIPLIVVNCIILGRAEAFASKNNLFFSLMDGIAMGSGFTAALCLIATFREILGNGTWLGIPLFGSGFEPALLMILPSGAFFTIAFIIASLNGWDRRRKRQTKPSVQ